MAGQEVNEILVRVVADTQQAEAELRDFSNRSAKSLGQSATNSRTEAQQGASDAREARRAISSEVGRIRESIARTASFAAGKTVVDALYNVSADRVKITELGSRLSDLRGELVKGIISQQQYNREAMASQKQLDELAKKYTGAGAALRGFNISMVNSIVDGVQVGVTIALVQAIFTGFGNTLNEIVNPIEKVRSALQGYADTVRGLGGEKGLISQLGMDTAEAQKVAAFAKNIELVAQASKMLRAEEELRAAGLGAGVDPTDPNLPLELQARQIAETRRGGVIAGEQRGELRQGGIAAGIQLAEMLAGNVFAAAFGVEGGSANLFARGEQLFETGDFQKEYEDILKELKDDVADATAAGQKKLQEDLLAALRSGTELTAEQVRLLEQTTTLEERSLLLSRQKNTEQERLNSLTERLSDISADIAELEGRPTGEANRDTLSEIDRRREALDRYEQQLQERQFQRQRRQQLTDMQASMARAGIRQAGQTSFDVAAAQREAEAQAARLKQGFRDEDQRRALSNQRERLDLWERSVRRQIELDKLRREREKVNADLMADSYIEGLQKLFTVGGGLITAMLGMAIGAAVGAVANGESPTSSGGTGDGRIGGRSLAPTPQALSRGTSTIVLQSAPIILDGEVVGRAIERRVTARSNRRGALGII
jgi:hypothetical protein